VHLRPVPGDPHLFDTSSGERLGARDE
jgi:hypothetical protein